VIAQFLAKNSEYTAIGQRYKVWKVGSLRPL